MTLPALKALFATLIAERSVSCTQPALDQEVRVHRRLARRLAYM